MAHSNIVVVFGVSPPLRAETRGRCPGSFPNSPQNTHGKPRSFLRQNVAVRCFGALPASLVAITLDYDPPHDSTVLVHGKWGFATTGGRSARRAPQPQPPTPRRPPSMWRRLALTQPAKSTQPKFRPLARARRSARKRAVTPRACVLWQVVL